LNPYEKSNADLVEALTTMKEKSTKGRVLVFDPLDGQSQNVLSLILSASPILNPRNNFTLNINDLARGTLDKQVGLHSQFILRSLTDGTNIALAIYKLQ